MKILYGKNWCMRSVVPFSLLSAKLEFVSKYDVMFVIKFQVIIEEDRGGGVEGLSKKSVATIILHYSLTWM